MDQKTVKDCTLPRNFSKKKKERIFKCKSNLRSNVTSKKDGEKEKLFFFLQTFSGPKIFPSSFPSISDFLLSPLGWPPFPYPRPPQPRLSPPPGAKNEVPLLLLSRKVPPLPTYYFFLQHSPPLSQHLPTSQASSGGRKEGRRRESSVADEKGDDEMRDGQGTHTHRVLPSLLPRGCTKGCSGGGTFFMREVARARER